MDQILNILTHSLDPELSIRIRNRVDLMKNTIRYMQDRDNEKIIYILSNNWTINRIHIICCLNSFYQIIVAPLYTSSSETESGLVSRIPIRFGNIINFTNRRANMIQEMYSEFLRIIEELDIDFWWLHANHAEDLIYKIEQYLRNAE